MRGHPERPAGGPDPVLVRRARLARLGRLGKRIGWLLLLVSFIAFVVGALSGYGAAVRAIVTICLLATTVTLAPAIVVGYAVRAAEREDRARDAGA